MLVLTAESVGVQDLFDCMAAGREWSKLVYSLCYLFSLLKERSRYNVLAWAAPLEINTSDWQVQTSANGVIFRLVCITVEYSVARGHTRRL
jgi:hypothetical protein